MQRTKGIKLLVIVLIVVVVLDILMSCLLVFSHASFWLHVAFRF